MNDKNRTSSTTSHADYSRRMTLEYLRNLNMNTNQFLPSRYANPSLCDACPNNPKNGGTSTCSTYNCILVQTSITNGGV